MPTLEAVRDAVSTLEAAGELVDTSFRVNQAKPYRLSSGRLSPYYVDCKMVLSYPEARTLIGQLMLARFRDILERVEAIGGLELSAYPLAIAVSDAVYRDMDRTVRAFVVRKAPKQHGLTKQLEGLEQAESRGKHVLVVDDVLTTGDSTMKAITKCREEGLRVRSCFKIRMMTAFSVKYGSYRAIYSS